VLATSFVTLHTFTAFTFYTRRIILFSALQRHRAWDIRSWKTMDFTNGCPKLSSQHKERLWLDNEKRMLACTRRSSEKDQDQTIRLCARWSFDLPMEDDELLPEEGVFCHELGLASGKVSHRTQQKRGIGRCGPVDEAVVERLKTHMCQVLDEGDHILQSIRFLF
jgi:hypothetical protein